MTLGDALILTSVMLVGVSKHRAQRVGAAGFDHSIGKGTGEWMLATSHWGSWGGGAEPSGVWA